MKYNKLLSILLVGGIVGSTLVGCSKEADTSSEIPENQIVGSGVKSSELKIINELPYSLVSTSKVESEFSEYQNRLWQDLDTRGFMLIGNYLYINNDITTDSKPLEVFKCYEKDGEVVIELIHVKSKDVKKEEIKLSREDVFLELKERNWDEFTKVNVKVDGNHLKKLDDVVQ